MLKKLNKIAALILLLSAMGTSTAFAEEPVVPSETPPAAVTGAPAVTIGTFAAGGFTKVTLDGTTQTTTSAVTDMKLTDARGTGAGWSVKLKASQFENEKLDKLPIGSLQLGEVTIEKVDLGSSEISTVETATGIIDKDPGVTILSAAENGGMGTYTVKIAPMTLTLLPKDAKSGTYTSTITMTLTQSPT